MIVQLIFLLALIISSVKSIIFLLKYLMLARNGIKTKANIVAIETSNFFMTKNAAIPKVHFFTKDNKAVMNKPLHSWFIELNGYLPKRNCITYYDTDRPTMFVIKSVVELVANFVMIVMTMTALIWFISTQF